MPLFLPEEDGDIVRARSHLDQFADDCYARFLAGDEVVVDRDQLKSRYTLSEHVIARLLRYHILVEETKFAPGTLQEVGARYTLGPEQLCYHAFALKDTETARRLAERELPELIMQAAQRRNLLLRAASRKSMIPLEQIERSPWLPEVDAPSLLPRIFRSMRDGTLRPYEVWDQVEAALRVRYTVNRQLERVCQSESEASERMLGNLSRASTMSGTEFEVFVEQALQTLGLNALRQGGPGEVDVVVSMPLRGAIECKNLQDPASPELHEAALELLRLTLDGPWDFRWVVYRDLIADRGVTQILESLFHESVRFVPTSRIAQTVDLHRKYLLSPEETLCALLNYPLTRSRLVTTYGSGEERPLGDETL